MRNETIEVEVLTRLLKLIGGNPEDLRELVDEYLEIAPALSASISSAAEAGNRDTLRIAAHTLKSNARDFGAMRLSELCAKLESACRGEASYDTKSSAAEIAQEESAARKALGTISLDALG